jgi:TatD DNase family protein
MQIQLIDSHCHLHYDYSPKSISDLIKEAQQVGVSHFITIGTDLGTLDSVQKVSEEFDCVFHTVGVHPHDASQITSESMETLEKAARHPKCRAIGEIGLDYHYDHSPRDTQIDGLKKQLNLAVQLKLPVIIHSREGEEDLLKELSTYVDQLPENQIPGVIHCFTGSLEFGKACLKLGFYISFSGILTFKNAQDIRVAAEQFPLERILIETDSPYLAPIPHRGKKCEPSMVRLTAQKLAEIKNLPFEKVAEVTTANSKRFFQI